MFVFCGQFWWIFVLFFVDWKRASRAFMVLSCLTFVVAILYVLMLQIKPRLPSILLAFILTISCEFNSIFQKFPLSLLLHPSYFLRHSLLICLDLIFYDTFVFVYCFSLFCSDVCSYWCCSVYSSQWNITSSWVGIWIFIHACLGRNWNEHIWSFAVMLWSSWLPFLLKL